MTRFTAILCLSYLAVQFQNSSTRSTYSADAYFAASQLVLYQRTVTSNYLTSTSTSDYDDLSDLWNSEEDHEDALWSAVTSDSSQSIGLEKQTQHDSDSTTSTVVKGPSVPYNNFPYDSDGVECDLWGAEEEEEEAWPGATDEIQRLRILKQTKQEAPAVAPPTPLQTKRPSRRRLPRPTEFWNLRLELIRDYKGKHGHIDVPYTYTVHAGDETVKLGSFLYWLRSLFEDESLKTTAPFEFVKELTKLGMKWRFLGKGRRPQLFLQRLNEWRDATREGRMEPTLRTWMWRQRYQFERRCEGLPNTLTSERIEALVDADIIPYQRPLRAVQNSWDKAWNNNLKEWMALSASQEHVMSPSLTLWAWEQWRMYDILRGDTPYKGELPVLLTGFRVKSLQEAAFFESKRPLPNLTPPDVDNSELMIEWNDIVDAIKSYYFDSGNFEIQPSCQVSVGGEPLYSLSTRLNREYKLIRSGEVVEGKPMLLSSEGVKELEDFGFFQAISVDPIQAEFEWWDLYHQFKKGRRDFLNGQMRAGPIARWVDEQDERYKDLQKRNSPDCMSEAHYESLRNLGFEFSSAEDREPPAARSAVATVVGRPPSLVTLNQDIMLGERLQLRKQNDMLEELTWRLRYKEMKDFANVNGHCIVPSTVLPRLALWTSNQRQQYKKFMQGTATPLNKERIRMLKEIEFDFRVDHSLLEDSEVWLMMTQALQHFQNAHKHCFVPASLSSNPQLGDWVNRQRQAYKRHELPRQQVQELQEIGLLLEMDDVEFYRRAFDVVWDERVTELVKLVEKNGHLDIDQPTLSRWTTEQRRFYQLLQENKLPSRLTKQRIDQLEQLGFDWTKS